MDVTVLLRYVAAVAAVVSCASDGLLFTAQPQSTIVKPCSSTTLTCEALSSFSNNTVNIQWTVNGSTITPTPSISARWRVDGGSLRVTSSCGTAASRLVTDYVMEGTYQCIATSSADGTLVSAEARVETAYLHPFENNLNTRPAAASEVIDIIAVEGNSAVVPCPRVDSKPSASIQFNLNGSTIITQSTGRHVLLPSGRLLISDVMASRDAGFYRCSAHNSVLKSSVASSTTYRLTVIAASTTSSTTPTFIWTSSDSVTVDQGQNLTLECAAHGVPVPVITWSKYGGQLPVDRNQVHLGVLYIENVDRYDAGTYLCKASNGYGRAITKVISVHVSEPPLIENAPTDQNTTEGSTVVFRCRAQGSPTLSTQWLFNGNSISSGPSVTIKETSLTLLNVNRRQSGIYQCIVRNGYGTDMAHSRLTVNEASSTAVLPSTTATSDDHLSNNTPSYSFDENDDQETDTWYDDISNPTDVASQKPTAKSSGKGTSSQWITPSRPRVTPLSDTTVRVQWTVSLPAVTQSQSSTIVAFKIQYRVIEMSRESVQFQQYHWQTVDDDIQATVTSFDVTGLPAGVTYRFRVVAIYVNGDNRHGPSSARITVGSSSSFSSNVDAAGMVNGRIEPSMRGPTIVEVRALSENELFVGWQYNEDERWPTGGFYIEYAPYDAAHVEYRSRQLVLGPNARHAIISRLVASTPYSIRMQSYGVSGHTNFRSVYSNAVVHDMLAVGLGVTSTSSDRSRVRSPRPPSTPDEARDLEVVVVDDEVSDPAAHPGVSSLSGGSSSSAGHLSPDNRTLFIVLGVTVGIVVVVLTMSAIVCFKKQTGDGRHWWYFETAKEQAKLASIHSMRQVEGRHILGGGVQCQGHVPVTSTVMFARGRNHDEGNVDLPVGLPRVCPSSTMTGTCSQQLLIPKPDHASCKCDEAQFSVVPTTPSAFRRPVNYVNQPSLNLTNQPANVVSPHSFNVFPIYPPPAAAALPPFQPTIDSSTHSPVYMQLTTVGCNDHRLGDDTSTFSSSIDVGLPHHQLTRWNNVDNLQMRLGSSASETMTICPPTRMVDLRDLPRPQPSRPPASPPRTRGDRAARPGIKGATVGDHTEHAGESDIDGDTSPMTSLYSTPRLSSADSVNSYGSLGGAGAMTSYEPLPVGSHDNQHHTNASSSYRAERHRTLADRVLDGAYQIQRRGVPN